MKPLALDADTVARFWKLYETSFPNQVDANRSYDTFRAICFDRGSQIFHGPGDSIVILTDVNMPPHNAALHMLAETAFAFRRREEFWLMFKELMDLFFLKKLTVFIPGPAKAVQKLYAFMGFLEEGLIRSAAMFDGDLVDITVAGLLRNELEDGTVAQRTEKKRKPSLVERTFRKRA